MPNLRREIDEIRQRLPKKQEPCQVIFCSPGETPEEASIRSGLSFGDDTNNWLVQFIGSKEELLMLDA